MMPGGRFWTVPNALSLSRIALLPLFVWALIEPARLWLAGALMAWGIVSDVLDGFLARLLKQESEWGRIIDPLADKLTVGVALLFCYVSRGLPLWVLVLVLGRDLSILLGAPLLAQRIGRLPQSNMTGRLAALSLGVVAVIYVLNIEAFKDLSLIVASILLVLSSTLYLLRLTRNAY
jgi:cardiolipin synthase